MQKNKNHIILIAIFIALVLMAVGVYFFYFKVQKNVPEKPVACVEGDLFDIYTGERCPGR